MSKTPQKTDRPAKRAAQTEAQREATREARKEEKRLAREKERLEAIEERKQKNIADRAALAAAGDYVDDFGNDGVFIDGERVIEPRRLNLPAEIAYQDVPLKGEPVDPSKYADYVSHDQRMVFLRHYSMFGSVGAAAWEAGTNTSTIRTLRSIDPHFDAQFSEAYERLKASIDMEVIRRGRDGWREPVFSTTMACVIGWKPVYDSQLLQMAAKRLMPEKYGEQVKVDHNVKGVLVIEAGRPSEEEWLREAANIGAGVTPSLPRAGE